MQSFRRGFTLLEVLIVVAVFGLLATLAVLSLNSARASLRDTQRLSDVAVLRAGLSQYWLERATYPVSDGVDLGAAGTNTEQLSGAGFTSSGEATTPVYLQRVPVGPKGNEFYRYRGSSQGYSIRFVTETETDLGPANVFYAHATGIDTEDVDR
jgi:prepilin-type N-terminal cleavage/methylation domain-containing protein